MDAHHSITPLAALIAGLAASAHCFAMCGGIAGALGMHAQTSGMRVGAVGIASAYQLGRIAGYTLAGAIVGFVGAQASQLLDLVQLGSVLRIASGVLILLLGLRLLVRWNALKWIEQLGARFWIKLRPFVQFASVRSGTAQPLVMGLLWSLLPCGLVYSMLLLAAMSESTLSGATIMLAFGAGTFPSMFSTSLLATRVQRHLSHPAVRIASGILMVGIGVWMVWLALQMGASDEGIHQH